jgi:hypothetical protein
MDRPTYASRPFLITVPAAVQQDVDQRRQVARDRYFAGRHDAAIEAMTEAYELLVANQPVGHRFHKGFPLQQLGLWSLEAGELPTGKERIQAFVEDVLSRGEESHDQWDELGRPAAQALLSLFNVPGLQLVDLARRLREAQVKGQLFQTPQDALEAEPLVVAPAPASPEARASELFEEAPEPFAPEWRQLGDFGTPLENRVFVGGSYAHAYLAPVLRAARDEARACGWDGVLVAEFKAPLGIDNRTKSLICLMGCRQAIFDLSESGGHQVEFEKLVDFGIRRVLVVYNAEDENARLRISSLTTAWFPDLHVEPKGYRGLPDLKRIVRDWLGVPESMGPNEASMERAQELANRLGGEVEHAVGTGVAEFLAAEARRRSTEAGQERRK